MTRIHIGGKTYKKEEIPDNIRITNKDVLDYLSAKLSSKSKEKGGGK